MVHECAPDVVINAQALSDVDRCEQAPELARAMNVQTVTHLVRALERTPALFVHVSTDYVFDGAKGRPYTEDDAPHPMSIYGRSKLAGEELALGYARALIVRTSTLFGPGRKNFCDHIVAQLSASQPVEAFVDQVTSPTYTSDAARAIGELVRVLWQADAGARPRLYHVANQPGCSRVAFAHRVADLLGSPRELIRAIPMAAQHRPAPRPACSALASVHLARVIGDGLRPWHEALEAYLRERHWITYT